MKLYILLPIILISGWSEVFSQREDYNWLLSQCSPLSDSSFSRIHWIFDDKESFTEKRTYKVSHILDYTNASISDSLGRLLFYTNGLSVYNRNYELMSNGGGLNPGKEAENSKDTGYKLYGGALILPWPVRQDKYLILHVSTDRISSEFYSFNLFTTLVDMKLDNGKGVVVYKNQSAYADSLNNGSLIACRHANGRDWWVPVFHNSHKKCFIFLLDPSGINLHHIQDIPFPFEQTTRRGQAQFSPDGSKYTFLKANNLSYREFLYAEFDRCSGIFSNIQIDLIDLFHWRGVAFSPNSKFLYLATGTELYQLDMNDPMPFKSRIKIDSIDGFQSFPLFPSYFSLMQLAPDNKIYINNGTSPDYLSTIQKPDLKGKACDVRQHNIHITGNVTIPNLPYFRLGALEGSICDTLNKVPTADWSYNQDSTNHYRFEFADQSKYEIKEWYWDFGYPGNPFDTSREQNPFYTFSGDGMYEVCLIVKNKTGSDTLCKTINITTVSTKDPNTSNREFKIWPNPTSGMIHILLPKSNESLRQYLTITDLNGKLVYDKLIFSKNEAVSLDLNPGIYFVKLLNQNGLNFFTKLLVQE